VSTALRGSQGALGERSANGPTEALLCALSTCSKETAVAKGKKAKDKKAKKAKKGN
jgi:hypothetical protein